MRELENLVRRLAALYPQDTITGPIVDGELETAPLPASGGGAQGELAETDGLSDAVERHLAAYFAEFRDALPPPGFIIASCARWKDR